MLTSVDKMWVAGVVSFISQYVIAHFFNITISADVQAAAVSLITMALTWLVPNKTAPT